MLGLAKFEKHCLQVEFGGWTRDSRTNCDGVTFKGSRLPAEGPKAPRLERARAKGGVPDRKSVV